MIGANFPVALAGFPWIDYHPSFPYSVFLGPGGAQYNTPQMYWQDIGVSVADVYAHTYEYNELYRRPIDPLGQLFSAPPSKQIRLFREVSRAYGASGVSWWDWQAATLPGLDQTATKIGSATNFTPQTTVAALGPGSAGDVVVWAQEHLLAAGETVTIDGTYGRQTQVAVEAFQQSHTLPVTGVIGPTTWTALLAYPTPGISWTLKKKQLSATVTPASPAARDGPPPRSSCPCLSQRRCPSAAMNFTAPAAPAATPRRAELRRREVGRREVRRRELRRAELGRAELRRRELRRAELGRAELRRRELRRAELGRAELRRREHRRRELQRRELRRHGHGSRGHRRLTASLRRADRLNRPGRPDNGPLLSVRAGSCTLSRHIGG